MLHHHIIDHIQKELERAKNLHPKWPKTAVRRAAVIAEEAGEALQAANSLAEYLEENETPEIPIVDEIEEKIVKEVIETGAMVFRFLENIE